MSVTLTVTESELQPLHDGSSAIAGIEGQAEESREAELIVFDDTTQGLGLKICGGCSTDGKEDYGIFVKRVLPGGLAEASESIQNGDLVLEVNEQSMEGISYDRAVSMLRQASASNRVEMVVTRDEEARIQYAHYIALHGATLSPRSVNDAINDSLHAADGDVDFQRRMSAFLKDASLQDLNGSLEQNDANFSARPGEMNGHVSPASSTASELANHLADSSLSPRSHPANNKSHQAGGPKQGLSVDGLDSMLSKKLSQDPGLRLHIDQLESAMTKLGFDFSPATQQAVREKLSVDSDGMVRFEEFVHVAKALFHKDLGALKGRITPHTPSDLQNGGGGAHGASAAAAVVVKERDGLLAQVASLKKELHNQTQTCHNKEEQLLVIRKQMQAVVEEGRSLKSKLHLAEQARARAQQTEHDYEEVVAMLENEVSQLRLQASKSDNTNMQKRLAVLVCQLKKAESGKKTYEVATDKLVRYVEHSMEVMSSIENSPRGPEGAKAKTTRKKALTTLAAEGRDTIKTVRSLMESVPLPFGWEEAYTSEGVRYYINHMNQTTAWTHPVSCMEHQTNATQVAPPHTAAEGHNGGTQVSTSSPNLPPPPMPHSSQLLNFGNMSFGEMNDVGGSKGQASPRGDQQQRPPSPRAPPRNSSRRKETKERDKSNKAQSTS